MSKQTVSSTELLHTLPGPAGRRPSSGPPHACSVLSGVWARSSYFVCATLAPPLGDSAWSHLAGEQSPCLPPPQGRPGARRAQLLVLRAALEREGLWRRGLAPTHSVPEPGPGSQSPDHRRPDEAHHLS